jgi:hypothetical protein
MDDENVELHTELQRLLVSAQRLQTTINTARAMHTLSRGTYRRRSRTDVNRSPSPVDPLLRVYKTF